MTRLIYFQLCSSRAFVFLKIYKMVLFKYVLLFIYRSKASKSKQEVYVNDAYTSDSKTVENGYGAIESDNKKNDIEDMKL